MEEKPHWERKNRSAVEDEWKRFRRPWVLLPEVGDRLVGIRLEGFSFFFLSCPTQDQADQEGGDRSEDDQPTPGQVDDFFFAENIVRR